MTSSLVQRYQKARAACALFHLENWGIISVQGPDSREFLQRLSTQDIKNLNAGGAAQTLFLKGDGRIVADTIALCFTPDHFLLLTPSECSAALLELLDRFHFAENLKVTNQSSDYYVAMISGPHRDKIALNVAKSCDATAVDCIFAEVTLAPASARHILMIPAQRFVEIRSEVYEAIEAGGGVIGGEDLYESLRIEEGQPRFGADLSDKTIPLEAGQKAAISFTKGCFPGQEIVARINNLGHPANVLVGLALPESTEDFVGCALLLDDKTVGRITSTAYSPGLSGTLGLGYVKWNQREPGVILTVSGEDEYQAVVTTVPLPGLDSE